MNASPASPVPLSIDAQCHKWAELAARICYFRDAIWLDTDPATVAQLANRIIALRTEQAAETAQGDAP